MTAAADIVAGISGGIASLGVPWWAWAALAVMIFFGLLVPSHQTSAEDAKVLEQRQEIEAYLSSR
jgi:hypothetical protein